MKSFPRYTFSKLVACLMTGFALILPAMASGVGDPAAAQALNDLLVPMESLSGKFSQVITDDEEEVVEENSGNFKLKRPGFFYWEIDPPFQKIIVSDQIKIWTYDPDLEQITIDKHNDELMQSPMLLLSGDLDKIQDNFEIQFAPSVAKAHRSFRLLPTKNNDIFNSMILTFANDKLVSMTLNNSLGEKQSYVFSDLQYNTVNDNSVFTFQPPANVDVVVNE